MSAPAAPLALLAEVTHRCPLHCPYCSNPLELTRAASELPTEIWLTAIEQAAALGVLQLHLSGGEPLARRDLEAIVAAASACGLYVNLITSALGLTRERLDALKQAGLDHVQISVQSSDASLADTIAGSAGAHIRKRDAARFVREAGVPLTLNAVVHRGNLDRLPDLIELAADWGAQRLEVAHVQYYGWALENRAALMPSRAQVEQAGDIVAAAKDRLAGRLVIDYVVPDYHARRPKACMGGWGRQFMVIAPDGMVLPCHAATTIPGLRFDTIRERCLADIWFRSPAFEAFRGTDWMPPPCRDCERREIDWGGCRCQALALLGDAAATDPVCELSPDHAIVVSLAEATDEPIEYRYRWL